MKKIFMILMLSLFGLSSVFAQVYLDSGLVAKYYFNGNANDLSGNGNNGTVNGATLTTDRFGNANSAYYFDGVSNNILINNQLLLTTYTISTWIKTDNLTYHGEIFSNGCDNFCYTGSIALSLQLNQLAISNQTGTSAGAYIGTPTIGLNWTHIAAIYNDANHIAKLYINGVEVNGAYNSTVPGWLDSMPSPNQNSSLYYHIGYSGGGGATNNPYFQGSIDDIRVYKRVLNDQEIQALYYENDCSNMPTVSISGLGTSYTTNDTAVTLTGTPAGGAFYGTGVIGNTFNPAIAGAGTYSIVYVYNNTLGCSKATCEGVTVSQGTLKVPEIQNPNTNIKIIPNPNNGRFNVTFTTEQPENISIQVINILGDVVYTETKNKHQGIYNNNINLNNLSNGNYVVNVKIGERITSEKIIIAK